MNDLIFNLFLFYHAACILILIQCIFGCCYELNLHFANVLNYLCIFKKLGWHC